jgi:Tfp pilus assembly protein PilO
MKPSKDKRNQLILVIFCTVAVVALMWFDLIKTRYSALSQAAASQAAAEKKLEDIQTAIKRANIITTELADLTKTLSNAESDMASGDLYSWTYDTIRLFKTPYQVDIPQIGHPDIGTVDLLPSFPFKQVKFTVTGTAYYHDLGKFVADFENTFPHIRVVNLQLQPAETTGGNEKLSFKMDIIALVKSSTSS